MEGEHGDGSPHCLFKNKNVVIIMLVCTVYTSIINDYISINLLMNRANIINLIIFNV